MPSGCIHWPFFTFTGLPVAPAATSRSVCRQRNAGICSTSTTSRRRRALLGQMHVGEDRQSGRRAHAIERGEPLVEPGPAARAGVRAIGLVEARLEDDSARHALGEPREVLADAQVERVVLEHTRTGDEEERVAPERRGTRQSRGLTSDGAPASSRARRFAAAAAAMKPANSGCGRVGRDCSSGWNWQPMNHGWSGSSTISTS